MFLRKLGKRGAEMVEYAIVLACIAAVGVGFYSSNDSKLTGVLDSLFGNVRQVLGLETATNFNGRFGLADADQERYAVFMDNLVNNLYNEMLKKTDDSHPPKSVWIEGDGTVVRFSRWDDENNKGGGSVAFDTPINVSDLLEGNTAIMPKGNTHIYFDKNGKVINQDDTWDGLSRVNLGNNTMLTFNSSSNTFGSEYDYWKK